MDLKEKLFKAMAGKLEANPEDLEAGERRVYIKGSPELGVSFVEAVALCPISQKGMAVVGEGSYDPAEEAVPGGHAPAYKFSTKKPRHQRHAGESRYPCGKVTSCSR